jgi:hypothetical protein
MKARTIAVRAAVSTSVILMQLTTAVADTYIATFSGHLTELFGAPFAVGDAASISVTYDSETPQSGFNSNVDIFYNTPSAIWTYQVGTYAVTAIGGSLLLHFHEGLGPFSNDTSRISGTAPFGATTPPIEPRLLNASFGLNFSLTPSSLATTFLTFRPYS